MRFLLFGLGGGALFFYGLAVLIFPDQFYYDWWSAGLPQPEKGFRKAPPWVRVVGCLFVVAGITCLTVGIVQALGA